MEFTGGINGENKILTGVETLRKLAFSFSGLLRVEIYRVSTRHGQKKVLPIVNF